MRKIKKGDEVKVITGKDKGRKGTVTAILKGGHYALVEGVNSVKKHVKPNPNTNTEGGIIIKTMPIHISNIMLCDQATDKGTRVGIKTLDDGRRVRFSKETDQVIDM